MHAILSMFPDMSFSYEAIEERQKFRWRAQKQIDRAQKNIDEWKGKLTEFKSLEKYDDDYVDLSRRLKLVNSVDKARLDGDYKSEKRLKGDTIYMQAPKNIDYKMEDLQSLLERSSMEDADATESNATESNEPVVTGDGPLYKIKPKNRMTAPLPADAIRIGSKKTGA